MKIAMASDVHGMYQYLKYPKADVLVFAGDLLNDCPSSFLQLESLDRFNTFLGKLDYEKIFVTFGNHDFCSQDYPNQTKQLLTNAELLMDSDFEYKNVKFYGSPWQSWFYDWAWNLPKNDKQSGYSAAKKLWSLIPDDTQVFICHGPPYMINDYTSRGMNVGCPILKDRLEQLNKLKLVVTGHIHTAYGMQVIKNVVYCGASNCNERYEPVNPIQVIDIDFENGKFQFGS